MAFTFDRIPHLNGVVAQRAAQQEGSKQECCAPDRDGNLPMSVSESKAMLLLSYLVLRAKRVKFEVKGKTGYTNGVGLDPKPLPGGSKSHGVAP
jgi:hypothetical protein